jgi:hypothetical protein
MTAMRAVLGFVACALIAGCSNPQNEFASQTDELNEASTPRKGSTINSQSVDPNATYWGARSISLLREVGYLTEEEADVANRADGIIANTAPNGRIGVDELAVMESHDHVGTLFPEEKAVIPKLWKILLIEDAPLYKAESISGDVTQVDTYTVKPVQYPIASLPSEMQKIAKRIQLTHDSDGMPATISGRDVADAYEDKGSYLPTEIAQFRPIVATIAIKSPLADDAQWIGVAADSTKTLLQGPLVIKSNVGYSASGAKLWSSGSITVGSADPSTTIIVTKKDTGADAKSTGDALIGEYRIELWKAGERVVQADVHPGYPGSKEIPYGYAVKIGTTLLHWGLTDSNQISYSDVWKSYPYIGFYSAAYLVIGKPGYRVDVLANGRVNIFDGTSLRACTMTSSGSYGVRTATLNLSGQTVTLDMAFPTTSYVPGMGQLMIGGKGYALMPY